ncbi:MAG: sugar ABC transporter substrate-binding protein [Caldilineaceae bacterium]|nr:sugar ABC transporter substrate-binding protein [Caldilineaceae bacterium]
MFKNTTISRRRFLIGSSAVMAGAALAACAPAAAPQTGQAGEAAQAPSSDVITLVFHSRLGSHADWHKSRVPLFEEQNPGLKLEIDELPGNEMYTKIYALAASGTAGDVCWTYLNNPPEHKAKGVMISLDDIIEAKGFDTSVFWPSIMDTLTLDGQVHAIPNHGHFGTVVYYYNKTMYEEAGLEIPSPEWTVDDLVERSVALTEAPEIWGFRASGGGQEHIPSYLRTFGGDLLNEEGTQCLLLEEGSVQALRWLYDLMETHKADPCLCGDQQRENFTAGKVGSFNTTPGLIAEFRNVTDWPFEWDATIGPLGPNGLRGSQVSGAAFCITGNSKHPFEAFQVLDFYSTKEDGIEHVYGGAGSPGVRFDVWEDPRLNEIHPIYKLCLEYWPEGPAGWHRPANARVSEFIDTMNNNLQGIWTGQVSFEQGIEQTYELCQEVLDKDSLL